MGSEGASPWFDREAEWRTRAARIDPCLRQRGWEVVPFDPARPLSSYTHHAVTEYPTANGPADYALFVDGRVLGILEAKRLALSPQNVPTQAERYARGLSDRPFDWDGVHAPFLYASNGEVIWFHDVRHPLNRSRRWRASIRRPRSTSCWAGIWTRLAVG